MTPLLMPSYVATVQSTIAQLDLPEKLTLDALRDAVSSRRERKLVVRRTEELAGSPVCAMTYCNAAVDLILFAPADERRREDHFVCHEFGHLLLGHHEQARGNVARPMPLLGASTVTNQLQVDASEPKLLGRRRSASCATFTVSEEKRAETFADIVMDRMWRAHLRPLDEPSRFAEVFG